jgi:hypothetical protein
VSRAWLFWLLWTLVTVVTMFAPLVQRVLHTIRAAPDFP